MIALLTNARMSNKLAVIGVITVLALVVLAAWAISGLKDTRSGVEAIEKSREAVEVANLAEIGTKEIGVVVRDLLLAQTQEDGAKAAEKSRNFLVQVAQKLTNLRGLEIGEEGRQQVDAIRGLWSQYGILVNTTIDASLRKLDRRALFFRQGPALSQAMAALVAEANKSTSGEGQAAAVLANRAESALAKRRLAIWRYLAVFEPRQLDEFRAQVAAFKELAGQLRASDLSDNGKSMLENVVRLSAEYDATAEEVIQQAKTATDVYFGSIRVKSVRQL